MRIIQFKHLENEGIVVGEVQADNETILVIQAAPEGVYALAQYAIENQKSLKDVIQSRRTTDQYSYHEIIESGRLLLPVIHPDSAHCWVTGTGLTHLGSAETRSQMHENKENLTDSMKMFQLGISGGKAKQDQIGTQPEWFYKGDGSILVAPQQNFTVPEFAEDAGEEPELVGIYLNDASGQPFRIGFALGNEFSDHITERFNYLWLAHSKLRQASFGPELLIGELPAHIEGESRIIRQNKVIWAKSFVTGEENMSHSITNLEHHHFKYPLFSQPNDLHVHYFGTATLSFADGIKTQDGDQFEIESKTFGKALVNGLAFKSQSFKQIKSVKIL